MTLYERNFNFCRLFGLQEFSLNMNGKMAKDLFYSVSAYQDFDQGTFKLRSTFPSMPTSPIATCARAN